MLNAFGLLSALPSLYEEPWNIQNLHNCGQESVRLTVQHPGANARGQLLQALEEILNLVLLDVAEICHEVGDLTSRVGHLLFNVVVEQNAVDCALLASSTSTNTVFSIPCRSTPGTFLWM